MGCNRTDVFASDHFESIYKLEFMFLGEDSCPLVAFNSLYRGSVTFPKKRNNHFANLKLNHYWQQQVVGAIVSIFHCNFEQIYLHI